MPRAVWSGAIQFGLVAIPVKLFLATESRGGLSFKLLCPDDLQPIQMKVYCPEENVIKRSDTVRGYEWSKGQYVVMEDHDFEAVPLKTVRSIEIEQFVSARRDRHSAVFVKQAYYVEPEPIGRKAFDLLRAVLADSELQAICKIVLREREQLAALDPFDATMLLSTLYWPDEVRDFSEFEASHRKSDLKAAELNMARQLVDALTGEFDASRYHDEYREALMRVIDAKVAGQPVEAPAPPAEANRLSDLMAVLEASVAEARGRAGEAHGISADQVVPATKSTEPVSVEKPSRTRTASGTAKSSKGKDKKVRATSSGSSRHKRTA